MSEDSYIKGKEIQRFSLFFLLPIIPAFSFFKKNILFMCVCMHIYTHTHIFQWNIIALNVELISEVQ